MSPSSRRSTSIGRGPWRTPPSRSRPSSRSTALHASSSASGSSSVAIRTHALRNARLVEDEADGIGVVGRRRREHASRRGRAARRPPPAGWRGGRRRSSRGRGSRSSCRGPVERLEQRELAALREQDAVARPQLAVLLEEAVGGGGRAEDARAPARRARGARPRAARGSGRSGRSSARRPGPRRRTHGAGNQASANIASAIASVPRASLKRSQPPVSASSAPANIAPPSAGRTSKRLTIDSPDALLSAAGTSSGPGTAGRRAGVVGRRGHADPERRDPEHALAAVLGEPGGERARRAPRALDGDVDPRRPGGGRAQVVAGERPRLARGVVRARRPSRAGRSRRGSRRSGRGRANQPGVDVRRPRAAAERRDRGRAVELGRAGRRHSSAWRQTSTETYSTGSGIGGSGFVALTHTSTAA